eukprot:gene21346-8120_t
MIEELGDEAENFFTNFHEITAGLDMTPFGFGEKLLRIMRALYQPVITDDVLADLELGGEVLQEMYISLG